MLDDLSVFIAALTGAIGRGRPEGRVPSVYLQCQYNCLPWDPVSDFKMMWCLCLVLFDAKMT